MNLYIETENNQAKHHPASGENLMHRFGEIPAHWEPFIRFEMPKIGPYEILESSVSTYQKIDGMWTDVWAIRKLSSEEKTIKQQEVITAFNIREQAENWSAWKLNEATCTIQPPIPRPELDQAKMESNIFAMWCGADNNWKDAPVRPEGEYKFDFFAWNWVPIVNHVGLG